MKALLLLMLSLFTAPVLAAGPVECINSEDMPTIQVQGMIRRVNYQHPNGTPLKAWILKLDTPLCYTQLNDANPPAVQAFQAPELQIVDMDNKLKLKAGTRVSITGEFSSMNITAWYLLPVAIRIE